VKIQVYDGRTQFPRPIGDTVEMKVTSTFVGVAAGPGSWWRRQVVFPASSVLANRLRRARASACRYAGLITEVFSEPSRSWRLSYDGPILEDRRCPACGADLSGKIFHPGPSVTVSDGLGFDPLRTMVVASDEPSTLILVYRWRKSRVLRDATAYARAYFPTAQVLHPGSDATPRPWSDRFLALKV
jgi:hypothetical protein